MQHIDRTMKSCLKFLFDMHQGEQVKCVRLHDNIDITGVSCFVPRDRTEKTKCRDSIFFRYPLLAVAKQTDCLVSAEYYL